MKQTKLEILRHLWFEFTLKVSFLGSSAHLPAFSNLCRHVPCKSLLPYPYIHGQGLEPTLEWSLLPTCLQILD